jgi:predicted DNA-binding transcriptional regulator YafY
MPETASSQLRRILHLIPMCEDDTPHPIEEMAAALDSDRDTLLRDLKALSDRFDDPGGFVEGVQVFVEPSHFSLRSDHFRRPMRLTLGELGALDLGLAMLEKERPPDEQDAIWRARERLRDVLAKLPRDQLPDLGMTAEQGADADPAILRMLREAIRESRMVSIRYASGSAPEATDRTVGPLVLAPSRGHWFLVGWYDGGIRIYRVDRVESATVLPDHFERPNGTSYEEVLQNGRIFHGAPEQTLTVRYSTRIAPWIAEREGKTPDADGAVTVEYPLGDVDWAVRHVLQYGPDAEVLGPAEVRARVVEVLTKVG